MGNLESMAPGPAGDLAEQQGPTQAPGGSWVCLNMGVSKGTPPQIGGFLLVSLSYLKKATPPNTHPQLGKSQTEVCLLFAVGAGSTST